MAEWKYVTRLGIQDRLDRIMKILNENQVVQKVIEQNRRRIEHLKKMQEWMNEHHSTGLDGPEHPPAMEGFDGKTKVV